MPTSGPHPVMPTFARELDDLATGHLALWLADTMPAGPALLWGCGRDLAVPLARGAGRSVVLLTDDEHVAATTIRHGAPGLRVAHVGSAAGIPDLSDLDLAEFATIIVGVDVSDPLDLLLPVLLAVGSPECSVCVIAPPEIVDDVVAVLETHGREVEVLDQAVSACSHVTSTGAPDTTTAALRVLGASTPERHLVLAGIRSSAASVLIGEEQSLERWRAGVDQMAATATVLDGHIDRTVGDRVEALKAEIGDLRRRLEASERRLEVSERAALAVVSELEAVRSSTSWKATAPLRSLTGLVRHR